MRPRLWLGFALFCLLSGSRWILDAALPPLLPPLPRAAIHHLLLGSVFTAMVLLRRNRTRLPPPGRCALLAFFASAVFALPDVVIAGAGTRVGGLSEALAFTLVPVVVVSVVAQQSEGFGLHADPRRLLLPALAGVFGAALLIPFGAPATAPGRLWLAALVLSIVFAGFAAVRLHALLQGMPLLVAAALASGSVCLASAACGGRGWTALARLADRTALLESALPLALDGTLLLLALWLLREMAPVPASTRYPLVLLVAIAESFILMHGSASWPMAAGALLMAGSAAWLLRAGATQAD